MIRIFHWFLVALFIALFITGNNNNGGNAIHIISGYLLTSFVLARIVWGFMGNENALWHNYLYSPKSTFNYLLKLSSLTPVKFKAHNPAGGTMILIMIIMLVAIITSGLLIQSLFELEGIFLLLATYVNDSQALIIKDIHFFLSYILLVTIGFHISGVIYSSYIYKANLPIMMVTGKITFFNKKKLIMSTYKYIALLSLYAFNVHSGAIDFNQLYRSWGVDITTINTTQGEQLWKRELIPNKSCTSCHTNNLKKNGTHVKTKKLIKPMSPKINQKRLTNTKKINKWLKRNCKFTYKRECTAAEKVNFIEFIRRN